MKYLYKNYLPIKGVGKQWFSMKVLNKQIAPMRFVLIFSVLFTIVILSGCTRQSKVDGNHVTITNVSYDTTREFYEVYNKRFHDLYQQQRGLDVQVLQSHGGSGGQARAVMEGNNADVVTLGSEQDVNLLARAGLINSDWRSQLPNNSAPYTSTIVMLVRKGNPKHIHDWNDIIAPDIRIIAPDPKSSSGACWIFLGAWYYGLHHYYTEEGTKEFVRQLYRNVSVMDSGARGATTTFVENGQGDVLLLWENEALYLMEHYPERFDLIVPSMSILAEPSVAVVTGITEKDSTTQVSNDYLRNLYTEESQRLLANYGFRPRNEQILREFSNKFDTSIQLGTVDDFGGWKAIYTKFFKDGGVFDEIYGS